MNKQNFSDIVHNELQKRGWSYRDAEKILGVQKDVFTRIKYQQEINLFSFLTLCEWLNKICGISWKEIMEDEKEEIGKI